MTTQADCIDDKRTERTKSRAVWYVVARRRVVDVGHENASRGNTLDVFACESLELCNRLGWTGAYTRGTLPNGDTVYVRASIDDTVTITRARLR